jgi:Predicted membrane protein (DUF2339)
MIGFTVLVILGLILWFIIRTVVAFSQIKDLKSELRAQADALTDLRCAVDRMRPPPASHPATPPAAPVTVAVPLAATIAASPAPHLAPIIPSGGAPSTPPAIPQPATVLPAAIPPPVSAVPPRAVEVRPPSVRPEPPVVALAPEPRASVINWELFMGVKLFAWLGGLALFLAVSFFVKYSFEHDLIPPAVRVALGFIVGAGLLAGGVLLSRRAYQVTAQTLCATGVVVLYAVTFACRSIYHFEFFGVLPTFGLMALITAAAFLLAVRLEAQVVAVLGMLGGFLTPVLLSTGVDNPFGLFGYIALLDVGLIAVALHRRWHYLAALGALGTALMQVGWVAKFFVVAKISTALGVFLGFDALFLLAFVVAQRRREAGDWLAAAAASVAFVSLGFAFYLLDYASVARQPGLLFALVLGADLCLLALPALDAGLAKIHLAAGSIVFVLLGTWTFGFVSNDLLPWALAASLVFAALHSVFPVVLQRLRPDAAPVWWGHLFPPVALLLTLASILKIPDISFLVWPAVLLVDLLAIGLAAITGSLLALAAVLVLSLVATGCWIWNIPVTVAAVPTLSLLLIGGFAVLFFAAGLYATRRLVKRGMETGAAEPAAEWLPHLPAMAAILPFLLLMMIVLRLPLTNPTPIFGLALLLAVLLLGLARQLGYGLLTAVALACMVALEWVWQTGRFEPAVALVPLAWYLGFFALFALPPFAFRRHFTGQLAPWVAAALSGPLHFSLVYRVVQEAWPNGYMGVIPAAFALPALVSLIAALRLLPDEEPQRLSVLAWFGGVALFFITLVFPVQFDRQWITLGWALEGMALLWLFHRVPHEGLRLVGVGLLVAAFVRLALNPAVLDYHPRSDAPIFNWYLYAYGLTTLCLFVGAWLLAPPRHLLLGSNSPPVLRALAGVLAFLLLNIEIADYFSPAGSTLTFQFSGSFTRDMTYTIAWALFALGLLVFGLWKRARFARYSAVGLLSVTLLKLFFHDLANLAQLYRVGAFFVLGVIAILVSFIYQRFLPPELKD